MEILNTKILLISLVGMLSLNGCSESDSHVKARRIVNISEAHIPNNGQVNHNIGITLKAEATNGCWSDLIITLNKIDDYHFLLNATGLLTSSFVCPEIMIYQDTIINFKPALPGKYFFQVNETPFIITRDTLVIN